MTAPASTTSRLARIRNQLYNALVMDDFDQQQLTDTLLGQRIEAYKGAINKQIRLVGCSRTAVDPTGDELGQLTSDSQRDAQSIVRTYNRDLQRALERIIADNPAGRRGDIESAIQSYLGQRSSWKDKQIALNTSKTARFYAEERFRKMNGIDNQTYYYFGPPPVSDECKANMAAGFVDVQYVNQHPTPAHINCPHTWQVVATPQVQDCNAIWVG